MKSLIWIDVCIDNLNVTFQLPMKAIEDDLVVESEL